MPFFDWQAEGPLFPGNFEEWNKLRQADGFLCTNDGDCQWMSDTKIVGGFVGLHCREEDVEASVKDKARYFFYNNTSSQILF